MDDAEPFGHYAHSDLRLLQLLQIRGASLSCLYFERFTGLEFFFSQATNAAISGLVWGGGSLLKRIYIPSTVFGVSCHWDSAGQPGHFDRTACYRYACGWSAFLLVYALFASFDLDSDRFYAWIWLIDLLAGGVFPGCG